MNLTNNSLKKIIRESMEQYRPQKSRNYNQVSPGMKSMANSAKRKFARDYPEVVVKIDGREGWIVVDGQKAVNISSASGSPMSIEDMIDKMKKAYLGHTMQEGNTMKITKRQLRRIIKETSDLRHRSMEERMWFDVINNKPSLVFAESGYEYDLSEYERDELDVFMGDYLTDHGAPLDPGTIVSDHFGIGMGQLPLAAAWDHIFKMRDDNY